MKKFLFLTLTGLALISWDLNAQVRTPAPSPSQKIEQAVGLGEIHVEYSRPSMKGRTIFGDLVPYDKIWRTGANQATKITFTEDVKVGGSALKKGSYAILTKPGKSSWDVMFYTFDAPGFGGYVEKTPDASVSASVEMLGSPLESFTIGIDHLSNDGAHLTMAWDKTKVRVPISVKTDEAVMASIERTMAGPSANDYSNAASYYLAAGKDLDKALTWINKSLDMNPDRFWIVRTKSLIQAKMGKYDDAIASAKKSLELATKAGNNDYIKMNNESIAEWMKK